MNQIGAIEIISGQWSAEWRMFRSCTLVVRSRGQTAVVDPAADETRLAQLAPAATVCINSHPHADHILYNPMFLHVPLVAPRGDAHFYDAKDLSELGPDAEALIGGHVQRRASRVVRRPDSLLDDGDQVHVGDVELRALAIPGHTPGLLCFHFPRERAAYVADYDLTDFGPWYGNTSSDPDQFVKSADRLRALDVDHYITAHEIGVVEKDRFEPLLDKFLAHVERRDQLLLDRLTEPLTFEAVADPGGIVYPARAVARSPWTRMWERQHVRKHLARLERRGAIRREDDRWRKT